MTILQQDGLRAIEQCPHGEVPAYLRAAATEGAWRFHHTLTDYAPTPLRALDGLAKELGVGKVFLKDESYRFGLNAFKGLGGIYALSRAAAQALGLPGDIAFSELQKPELQERLHKLVFVTTTDGNHGRGVAWAAHRLGCEAHVFLPNGSAQARAQAILDVGAVEATTLAREAVEQLAEAGVSAPTHVFLQAGVGAMAGGVLAYLADHYGENVPKFAVVEPEEIPCIFASVQAGDGAAHPYIAEKQTIMAGLNCGEPCMITWPVLRDLASWYFACPDAVTEEGMRLLGRSVGEDPKVISGESGAVTAGLLHRLCTRPALADLREKMGLDETSVVLLISTEGDTDPEAYQTILANH